MKTGVLTAVAARERQVFEAVRVLKNTWKRQAFRAGSWLVVAAFAWQLLYVPVHLLLECHYEHEPAHSELQAARASGVGVVTGEHCQKDHGSGHVPHCVSDHSLPATTQAPMAWMHLDLVLADSTPALQPDEGPASSSVFERCSPPARPPPGPSLPRAPPLA